MTPQPDRPFIVDADLSNFPAEVLERSHEVPVVVDFWAPWCGPCRTLSPVLERIAMEMQGAFVLAKVNTDTSPSLAQQMQVQGIPAVKLFRDGRVVDEFTGALPEASVRAFIDRHLPSEADLAVARAREMEEASERESAVRLLRSLLRDEPRHVEARVLLAKVLLDLGRRSDAEATFRRVPGELVDTPEARAVRARLELGESGSEDLNDLERRVQQAPGDIDARIRYGRALVASSLHAQGLEQLLEAFRRDPQHGDGAARRAMLEAFDLLGSDHPLVKTYRGRLSMLLFA